MMNLQDLESYLKKNKHLPRMPSREEILKDKGVNLQGVGMMNLEKTEENTLYIIELEKKIESQNSKMQNQQKTIEQLTTDMQQQQQQLNKLIKKVEKNNVRYEIIINNRLIYKKHFVKLAMKQYQSNIIKHCL